MIPKSFVQAVIERTDIVDVINRSVPLKKEGAEYKSRCPFHQEKSPSFTVSQSKQFYHCFGCGAHGDAISFLQEYTHLSFIDALSDLAAMAGLAMPEREESDRHEARRKELEGAQKRALTGLDHPDFSLVAEKLGVGDRSVKSHSLGFIPEGHEEKTLGLPAGHGGVITMPIRIGNNLAGFAMMNHFGENIQAKQTDLLGLSSNVAGLRLCEINRVIVVERYLDMLTLTERGKRSACPARLDSASIRVMLRKSKTLILCFSDDHAGRSRATEALRSAFSVMDDESDIRFLFTDSMSSMEVHQAIPMQIFFREAVRRHADSASTAEDLGRQWLQVMPECSTKAFLDKAVSVVRQSRNRDKALQRIYAAIG